MWWFKSVKNAFASMALQINFEREGFLKGFGKCVAVRICARFCFCGESISKNAFRRFESGYGSKNPEMHLQNFEKLQGRKNGRNLSKSPVFSFFLVRI